MSLLSISSLKAYYGESQALFDVNLEVNEGEIVALMGEMAREKHNREINFPNDRNKWELLFSGKNL